MLKWLYFIVLCLHSSMTFFFQLHRINLLCMKLIIIFIDRKTQGIGWIFLCCLIYNCVQNWSRILRTEFTVGLIIILSDKSNANIELILCTFCITHLVVWQNLAWLVFFSSSKHAVVENRGLWRFCRNAVDKRTQTHEKSRSKCHFQELWINILSQSSYLE